MLSPLFRVVVAFGSLAALAAARSHRITVAAADVDRAAQVVEFKLPADAQGATAVKTQAGAIWPLQIEADGTATFIVPEQKAGEALALTLSSDQPAGAGVQVGKAGGQLVLAVNGARQLGYQMDKKALPRPDIEEAYQRAGYLHPVFTPSGRIVSDDYPKQHVHHHGIWVSWTETRFQGRTVDFWNMGKGVGTVEFVALDRTWSGPVHGGFVARHRFVDLQGGPAPVAVLNEVWEVTLYHAGAPGGKAVNVFDLQLTQAGATSEPLLLPKFHYGGLGYRAPGEWFGAKQASFLTSEGETDRVKANHQKMRWVHVSGAAPGGVAGLAVLGHPANFRAPQPVRVHEKEPYVSFTPSWEGEWRIEPGKPYVARYRFIAADGPPERARLEAFWHAYASPAVVKLEPR